MEEPRRTWRDAVLDHHRTAIPAPVPKAGDAGSARVPLFEAHAYHRARLFAFVVMPEHIHCLTVLGDKDASKFVHSVKKHLAFWLKPLLTPEEGEALDTVSNSRAFWMRSYRGLALWSDPVIEIKTDYIHENPVRRRLCKNAPDYRWSSVLQHLSGDWNQDFGFSYQQWLRSVLVSWLAGLFGSWSAIRPYVWRTLASIISK